MKEAEQEWLQGRATLGTATKWTAEEIRLVAELGYGLAEQGRVAEAIVLFEGLSVLSPATTYFQSALGALWIRENKPEKALSYLNQVVQSEPNNVIALVNRGESFLRLGERAEAIEDFQTALAFAKSKKEVSEDSIEGRCLIRARALLMSIENQYI